MIWPRKSSATWPSSSTFPSVLAISRKLLFEHQVDLSLERVGRYDVVNLSGVLLAVAMNSPDALLQVHRELGQRGRSSF